MAPSFGSVNNRMNDVNGNYGVVSGNEIREFKGIAEWARTLIPIYIVGMEGNLVRCLGSIGKEMELKIVILMFGRCFENYLRTDLDSIRYRVSSLIYERNREREL